MTSEMREKSYRAVRCYYCLEPIPVSAGLLEIFVAKSDNAGELQRQSQVFILRCQACSKECRYLKTEIEAFEGEAHESGGVNRAAPKRYAKALHKAAGQ
jgi:hypothetical protein